MIQIIVNYAMNFFKYTFYIFIIMFSLQWCIIFVHNFIMIYKYIFFFYYHERLIKKVMKFFKGKSNENLIKLYSIMMIIKFII